MASVRPACSGIAVALSHNPEWSKVNVSARRELFAQTSSGMSFGRGTEHRTTRAARIARRLRFRHPQVTQIVLFWKLAFGFIKNAARATRSQAGEGDGFYFEIFVHAVAGAFASEAGLFHAAERNRLRRDEAVLTPTKPHASASVSRQMRAEPCA